MSILEATIESLEATELGRDVIKTYGHICIVRKGADGKIKSIHETHNIVTDAGDLYYAERGVAGTQPTNFTASVTPFLFNGVLKMYRGITVAPFKGADLSDVVTKAGPDNGSTTKAAAPGYPKVNDLDTANTGKGIDVLTYKFAYTAGDWDDSVQLTDLLITLPAVGASDPLLMWADGLSGGAKSNTDTLDVYINHTFVGS